MARRHTPDQVIAKVRQGQRMLNDGRPMIAVVMELQIPKRPLGRCPVNPGEHPGYSM